MTQYITETPGLPANVRTEDDMYTPITGETSFDHNPSNAELNALYDDTETGRLAAIAAAFDGVNDTIFGLYASIPPERIIDAVLQNQQQDGNGVYWLQNFVEDNDLGTLYAQRNDLSLLLS